MSSVNKVILVGNVGKDPEVRTFGNGGKVANFSIATSEKWRDKQSGEQREKTEWLNIAVFGEGLVGVIERYVKKGSKLYIEGKLQTRKWQDRDGNEKYTTEVVLQGPGSNLTMLDSRQDNGGQNRTGDYQTNQAGGYGNQRRKEPHGQSYDIGSDVPF